jgi:hypothetical protein
MLPFSHFYNSAHDFGILNVIFSGVWIITVPFYLFISLFPINHKYKYIISYNPYKIVVHSTL